jgi:hypothetical protein
MIKHENNRKGKLIEMKKIKFYVALYFIVLCISACGIVIGMGFDKIRDTHPEYLSAGIPKGIVIFILAQLITVYLHEMVHAIAYKLQGIHIRMLYLFPLCIVKEEGKLKICKAFNLQIGLGGLVIPKLPVIQNDSEYDRLRKKMSVSVFCAPFFSAVVGMISFLLACCTTEYISSENRSYYFLFFIAMFLWSIYINVMSILSVGNVVGDYAGAKKLKTDEVYSLLQIYNYFLLQDNKIKREARSKQAYLVNRMYQEVKELPLGKGDNSMNFSLADSLLFELILSRKECSLKISEPESLDNIIQNLQERLQFESYSCFFSHAIMYLGICGKADEARLLWERYKEKMSKTKTACYQFKQVELFLYKSNDFKASDDIAISSMDSLLSKLSNYYDDEIYLNNLMIHQPE